MKSLRTITREALDSFVPMTVNSIHDEQFNIKRKIILSVVCFAFISMLPLYAQQASAVLHHEGTVKAYSPTYASQAFTDAVFGDTIYLSEGVYTTSIEVGMNTSAVTVIGAGQETVINGDFSIRPTSNNKEKTISVQGLNIQGNLIVDQADVKITISQCKVGGYVSFSGTFTEDCIVNIDRCYFNQFYLASNITQMTVSNCKVVQMFGDSTPEKTSVVNCNIKTIDNSNSGYNGIGTATYSNCIIGGWSSTQASGAVFMNCLGCTNQSTEQWFSFYDCYNCWFNTDFTVDDDINCSLTDEQLVAAGYVGTDDTAVGCGGGVAPYTLTPAVPRITDHTISVDSKTRKLNVSLTIGN